MNRLIELVQLVRSIVAFRRLATAAPTPEQRNLSASCYKMTAQVFNSEKYQWLPKIPVQLNLPGSHSSAYSTSRF